MLVNEHVTVQDAANCSLKEEVAFLKQTLAKQTHEQSEMFHYFHDKTDEHVARIAELEKAVIDAQDERENLVVSSQEALESEQRERALEQIKAQEEVVALKEELRQVRAFAVAKRELEAHTRALETKLDAQRAAFQTQIQDLERHNLLEQARAKQELLGRMQAAKTELMLRTNDQVASNTHRTLLENAHFTHELAFQSRETEKLLERLDEAQQEVSRLRAQNKVLEENEQMMAKKNRYYQKIIAKLQQPKPADGNKAVQLQGSSQISWGQNNGGQLQRALEWLRVFQRERQFLLAQQDEVIQFLYRSLDEAAEAQHRKSDNFVSAEAKRVEELVQLAPSTTTMDAFGRRVLVSRPALDELSSEDCHDVLLFLLEKLHLYQVRIAAVYPNGYVSSSFGGTSPVKQILERQLGVELPPIASAGSSNLSPSSIKQKRRIFAHVAAAVEAGNTEWLGSPKSKVSVHPQSSQAPLSPQLLAMATNQFNFVNHPPTQRTPTKKRYQQLHNSSFGKNTVTSPPRKNQVYIKPLIPSSTNEALAPWPNTASTASISQVFPVSDSDNEK
ncbi:Flagellar associated protein [Phytophthora palmivora]|uniref:Cilia- and flagella-associated protein 157 n=1 Tax=Phytophthora palmivora TaxID=4796 RepID=A0A2P4YVL0_9STRA|nr:Flagellar associated protein [Phytophthora palmivora]